MDPSLPLLLGLGSALSLSGANTLVKAAGDVVAARGVMSIAAAVLIFPAVFFHAMPSAETWTILAISLPAHWLYQAALVRAMSRGDLSLVFPVMRGVAPLLTALAALVVLNEQLSTLALFGLAIASLATIVFALPEHRDPNARRIRNSALLWALATGVTVALYNVIDAVGVRSADDAWTFIIWLFLLDWIGITVVSLITRRERYVAAMRKVFWPGVGAGALTLISFSLTLIGIDLTKVAYISALRETSVVFAALMGWWFLKEGFGLRRVAAAVVLAIGLLLLEVAG